MWQQTFIHHYLHPEKYVALNRDAAPGNVFKPCDCGSLHLLFLHVNRVTVATCTPRRFSQTASLTPVRKCTSMWWKLGFIKVSSCLGVSSKAALRHLRPRHIWLKAHIPLSSSPFASTVLPLFLSVECCLNNMQTPWDVMIGLLHHRRARRSHLQLPLLVSE